MRKMKVVYFLLFSIILFILGYFCGKIRQIKDEVFTYVPIHVRIYNDILTNNYDRATNYLGILIMRNVDMYDKYKNILGSPYLKSDTFNKLMLDARKIYNRQSSNMVIIGPMRE